MANLAPWWTAGATVLKKYPNVSNLSKNLTSLRSMTAQVWNRNQSHLNYPAKFGASFPRKFSRLEFLQPRKLFCQSLAQLYPRKFSRVEFSTGVRHVKASVKPSYIPDDRAYWLLSIQLSHIGFWPTYALTVYVPQYLHAYVYVQNSYLNNCFHIRTYWDI